MDFYRYNHNLSPLAGTPFAAPMFFTGKLDKTRFKMIPNQFCKQTMFFGFSKKSPAKGIILKINKVIAEIKKDGTISRIMGCEKNNKRKKQHMGDVC